jgi:hypothetical protein
LPTRRRQRVFERDGDGGIRRWQFAAKQNKQNLQRPRPVFPAAASKGLLFAVGTMHSLMFFSAADLLASWLAFILIAFMRSLIIDVKK